MSQTTLSRLTREHFALYRAWLEGVDITALHSVYGASGTDVRVTRRLIRTLRDTLATAARRAHDTSAVHLLRLKPGAIPADAHAGAGQGSAAEIPTLEVWREAVDPDGVYNEAELLALYIEAYPPATSDTIDRKVARNRRLRERQTKALARMEASLVEDPQLHHPLDGWFDPVVIGRLRAAGVTTLADLMALIRRRRHRWYVDVPKLGPKGAQRITDWLGLNVRTLGSLSPLATTPRRQLGADDAALTRPSAIGAAIVPLEALRIPTDLDGSAGLNRAPVPAHQAELNTDWKAVTAWVQIRGARSADTARAYRREAERLLLWAIVAKGKPLSSLNTLDCAEYVDRFLRDPQPAERWVGRGRVERFDPAWRPFAGPLSDRSRETARRILAAMCAWLVKQQYLVQNPFDGQPVVALDTFEIDTAGRTLTHAQWRYLLQTTTRLAWTVEEQRDHFALLFAYLTGLRRAELAAASTGRLSRKALDGVLDDAWMLRVDGKGRRRRDVSIPSGLIEQLRWSLQRRPVATTLETAPAETPLLAHLKTGTRLTPDAVARLYKRLFERAAKQLEATYPGAAADLRRASTHWLRHTYVNHALDAGEDIRDVQATAGHDSLATTTIYTKPDLVRRHQAAERRFLSATGQNP